MEGYDIDVSTLTFIDEVQFDRFRRALYQKPTGEKIEVAVRRLDSIDKERLHLMKNLKHSNIVQLIGIYHDEHSTYMVTEYADNGNLKSYLERNGAPPYDLMMKWSREICAAVEYLHSHKCVHTDIRPSNILIMSDNSLKLSSLELVTEWDQTKSHKSTDRTCVYMAPEVINNQFRSFKSDIFSTGMILWQIISGRFPYSNMKGDFYRMNAIISGERPRMPDNCPLELSSLLESCWKTTHKDRPPAEALARSIEGGM